MKSECFDSDDNVGEFIIIIIEVYNKEEGINKFKSMVIFQASYCGRRWNYITIRKTNTKHR